MGPVFPILLAVACLGLIVFGMLRLVKGGDGAAGVQAFKINISGSSALIIIAMGLGGLIGLWFLDTDHADNDKAPPSEATLAIPDEVSFEESFADEPYTFGDDGDLDALWLDCDAGAMQACDDLYQQSPVDSEYEFFGGTCGLRFEGEDAPEFCVDAPIDETSFDDLTTSDFEVSSGDSSFAEP